MNAKSPVSENLLQSVLDLLNRLEKAKIHYKLTHSQDDAISINVVVPGQRWEIDCYSNGRADVEIFKSDGSIRDASAIDELFRDFSD